jgi:hypothetical protein
VLVKMVASSTGWKIARWTSFGQLRSWHQTTTTIPTRQQPAVLLDAGANAECRPGHLLQFAVMGAVYAQVALGVQDPRVGLLSIGEEETKGNELTREAHRLLKAAPVRFLGRVPERRIRCERHGLPLRHRCLRCRRAVRRRRQRLPRRWFLYSSQQYLRMFL